MTLRIRAVATALVLSGAAHAGLPTLIHRSLLFGNPERAMPLLSPDGKRVAYAAPDDKDVLQVWVRTVGKEDAKAITADEKRGIRIYLWAADDRTVLYLQDNDGDENFHLYGADVESGSVRDYTPFQGVRARIVEVDPDFPDSVLVATNQRRRDLFDAYRLDLRSGALTLVAKNPGDVSTWFADAGMEVRGALVTTPEGGTEIRIRDSGSAPFRALVKAGLEDNLSLEGFSKDGNSVFLFTSIGHDTARVVERSLRGKKQRTLAQSDEVDAGDAVVNPRRHVVEAVSFATGRAEWKVVDPSVAADFDALRTVNDGDFEIVSRDRADHSWIVRYSRDTGPVRYYLWDRGAQIASLVHSERPSLEGLPLATQQPIRYQARDGLTIHGYLTLPVGVAPEKLPLVLYVHGGPWGRDTWGYDATVQWLANRGYAVLRPNFRGSTGYGKKFLHAGDREWGKAMHTDLVDGVSWAIARGIADQKRIAIYGGSYGGYAALAGATFTPDLFKCAVDIVGPSNLFTLLRSVPPYWKAFASIFRTRIGNIDDPEDEPLLRAASPLFAADRIRIPILIGQGANDPRVKQAESEQIVAAIERNRGTATYVLYPDEGHGFARPPNRMDFNARAEQFLAEQLGGRAEPMQGERLPGSTAVIRIVGGAPTASVAGVAR
jgi:dipeptidyl aminopeptidase/acylaminoacyl peptidase